MSTETVTTTAVETPVQTETPAAPVQPQSAVEARKGITERARGVRPVAQQVNEANTQPRDAQGRFINPTAATAPVTETAPPATQPDAEAATTSAVPAQATADVEGRTSLPENDPLRSRGKSHIEELAPNELRSLIKRAEQLTPAQYRAVFTRLDELSLETVRQSEQLQERARELERDRQRKEREAQAYREQLSTAYKNPEVAARYHEILEAWGEAEANRYLRGVEAEQQDAVSTRIREGDDAWVRQQAEEAGARFASQSMRMVLANNRYEAWAPEEIQANMNRALLRYGIELREGLVEQISPTQFILGYLDPLYTTSPAGQQRLQHNLAQQKQAEAERIRNEAAVAEQERQKQQLEQYAEQQRTNPLGRVSSAQHTGQTLPVSVGPTTAAEARKRISDRRMGRLTG